METGRYIYVRRLPCNSKCKADRRDARLRCQENSSESNVFDAIAASGGGGGATGLLDSWTAQLGRVRESLGIGEGRVGKNGAGQSLALGPAALSSDERIARVFNKGCWPANRCMGRTSLLDQGGRSRANSPVGPAHRSGCPVWSTQTGTLWIAAYVRSFCHIEADLLQLR